MMPDTFNIPENAIEPIARAICDRARGVGSPPCNACKKKAIDVIQACLKEWGGHEERQIVSIPYGKSKPIISHRRLVFPWEPVEGNES